MKKVISTALVCLMAIFALSGCTNNHKDELKQAFENNAKWESYKATIACDIKLVATGSDTTEQDMSFSGNMEYIKNKKTYLNMTLPSIFAMLAGTSSIVTYQEYTDNGVITYTYNGTTWTKQTSVKETESSLLDATTLDLTDAYSILLDKANFASEETIDSASCYKYEMTLDWDTLISFMQKVAEKNPDAVPDTYKDSTQLALLKTYLSPYPPIKIQFWVDKSNVQIKQMLLDATDTVKAYITQQNKNLSENATESSSETIPFNVNKLTAQIKYSDVNNVSDITIPDAAKNAKETVTE